MKPAATIEMLTGAKNISKRRMGIGTLETDCGLISQAEARGSLSEAQYFVHLARRLAYLTEEEAADLDAQIGRTFGCLHGLIQAVEKETGKIGKAIAAITSLMVIGFARLSSGQ